MSVENVPKRTIIRNLKDANFAMVRSGKHEVWRSPDGKHHCTVVMGGGNKTIDPNQVRECRRKISAYLETVSQETEVRVTPPSLVSYASPENGTRWIGANSLWTIMRSDERQVYLEDRHGDPGRYPIERWPGIFTPVWPPQIDTTWVDIAVETHPPEPSFTVTVKEINSDYVRLYDHGLEKDIYINKHIWPATFIPLRNYKSPSAVQEFQGVLVGGDLDELENIEELVWEYMGVYITDREDNLSLDMAFHITTDNVWAQRGNFRYPEGVEVIIILADKVPGTLRSVAERVARQQNIPVVITTTVEKETLKLLFRGMRKHWPDIFYREEEFGAIPLKIQRPRPWVLGKDGETWELYPEPEHRGYTLLAFVISLATAAFFL